MDQTEKPDPLAPPKREGMYRLFRDGAGAILRARDAGRVHHPRTYDEHGNTATFPHFTYSFPEEVRWARMWHCELQSQHDIHASVKAVLLDDYLPRDWHQLLLEWPALSTDGRLAYTADDRKGKAVARTVTTAGRYIKRHWPLLGDTYIRDLVARTSARIEVWSTADQIVRSVQEGPYSCMQWRRWHEGDTHPYQCYDPGFGWRAVVRMVGAEIAGRALVLHASRAAPTPGETMAGAVSVRSYRGSTNVRSHADEALDAWLASHGAHREGAWPDGARLARIEPCLGGKFAVPYIDGNTQRVTDQGDYLVIDDGGEYICTNKDGTYDDAESDDWECSNCGENTDSDDGIYVGYGESQWIGSCCSDEYTMAYGRHEREYYVPDDDVVHVDGTAYYTEYLGDNNIVALEDGDYAHMDNAFCCEVNGEWYLMSDGVRAEDKGAHVARCNAWRCEVSRDWYSYDVSDERVVLADGRTCHAANNPGDDPDGEEGAEEEESPPALAQPHSTFSHTPQLETIW